MKGDRRRQALAAALLGAVALSLVLVPTLAQAASRTCRQIEAELAGAPRGPSSPAQLRKYDGAIARQRDEIDKARGQARHLGCGFSIFSSDVAQCASLNAALTRMNGNLDALERKRAKLATGDKGRTRASLLALLDKHDCRGRQAADKAVTIRSSNGGIERLLGETIERADRPNEVQGGRMLQDLLEQPDETQPPAGGGQYRTMCVRTCDGYFFPMSNAASVADFERDQKNCESSCPGADIEVFYTQAMGEDSSRMISVATGRSYAELPTAYLYKKPGGAVPRSCGCNAPKNFSIVGGSSAAHATAPGKMQSISPSVTVMPAARPDPAADPETQANTEGGLDADTIRRLAAEAAASKAAQSSEDRKIRVVGPRFLPDPSAAIDLRARAPKPGP